MSFLSFVAKAAVGLGVAGTVASSAMYNGTHLLLLLNLTTYWRMNPKWKEKEQKDSFWVSFFWFGTRSRPFLFFFFPWFLSGSTCSLVWVCVVEGGQRAVIFDRLSGVKKDVVGEGTHFLIPWLQRPVIFDVRIRPRRVETVTGSKGNTRNRFFCMICFNS